MAHIHSEPIYIAGFSSTSGLSKNPVRTRTGAHPDKVLVDTLLARKRLSANFYYNTLLGSRIPVPFEPNPRQQGFSVVEQHFNRITGKGLKSFLSILMEHLSGDLSDIAEAEGSTNTLTLLAATHNSQECRDLARRILESPTSHTSTFLRKLRDLLGSTTEDYKRACLLQLLAELGDTEAIQIFIAEISRYASQNLAPNLSLIVAVTYIRFFRIASDKIPSVLERIEQITAKALESDFPERKALLAGIIVTLGTIGQLKETVTISNIMLEVSDPDIVEGCLYNLSNIWRRAGKSKEDAQYEQYQVRTSEAVESVLNLYVAQIKASRQKEITVQHRIVVEACDLLAAVWPAHVVKKIPKVFTAAVNTESKYLLSAVTSVLRGLSPNEIKKAICKISRKTTLGMDDVIVKLLQGGADTK